MFKTAKFSRISENIVQQIRQAILQGKLRPGDRLPPEKELAERFGVSKASLREAFRALEALGLLEVRQGVSGGAFVREVDLKTARDSLVNYLYFQNPTIEEFCQLRAMLEPEVAEAAARKITDTDLSDLERNLVETKKTLDGGTFSHDLEIYFHQRIASIANNRIICLFIDSIQHILVDIKLVLETSHDFSVNVYRAHKRIFDALRERNPERARIEMLRHMKEVEEGLLLCYGLNASSFMFHPDSQGEGEPDQVNVSLQV